MFEIRNLKSSFHKKKKAHFIKGHLWLPPSEGWEKHIDLTND